MFLLPTWNLKRLNKDLFVTGLFYQLQVNFTIEPRGSIWLTYQL
jgi:hypothetical protein